MRRTFVYVALCALGVAAPAAAEKVYVPVIGATAANGQALQTRVWAGESRGENPAIVSLLRDGGARDVRVISGGRVGGAGEVGLVAIDVKDAAAARAFLTSGRGDDDLVEVPLIRADETWVAGAEPSLGFDDGELLTRLLIGAANLGDRTASCQARLYGAAGEELARIPFTVAPLSLAREEAAAWTQAAVDGAQVTCDQTFRPLAVGVGKDGQRVIVANDTGPNGDCTIWLTLTKQTNGTYTVSTPTGGAPLHQATQANPKGIACIRTPNDSKGKPITINAAKAVFDWDFTPNSWSSRNKSGVHNVMYTFLERFRSGVVGNINLNGPSKNKVKFVQNVGLPKCGSGGQCLTKAESGFTTVLNTNYHATYTFNAAGKAASLTLQASGMSPKTIGTEVKPGNNQTLVIRPYGKGNQVGLALVVEFGNYFKQHPPEEPSCCGAGKLGWIYNNFTLVVTPKPGNAKKLR